MTINWGQQAAIPAPQVVGSIPVQPQQGLDQLAGGALSGLAQGQQIQSNALALGQQRQQIQDQQDLRAAAQKGEDAWMQTLISQGQVDKAKAYQATQLQYQNALLQNKASVLELNDKQHAKADRDNSINVAVMGAISQMPPEQRDSAYQKYRMDMKKQYPDIVMPDHFSPDTMASVMRTNEIIQQTQQLKMTDDVATLTGLQRQRDAMLIKKQELMKAGQPTDSIDQALKEVQGMINDKAKVDNKAPDATALEQKVNYVRALKDKVDSTTDPVAKRKAQEDFDLAMSQMKQDSMWSQIKSKIADVIGGGIGMAVNAAMPSAASSAMSAASSVTSKSYTLNGQPFDMDAAKKATGLSEAEIIKQAGLK